jgi:hypothetical protein
MHNLIGVAAGVALLLLLGEIHERDQKILQLEKLAEVAAKCTPDTVDQISHIAIIEAGYECAITEPMKSRKVKVIRREQV